MISFFFFILKYSKQNKFGFISVSLCTICGYWPGLTRMRPSNSSSLASSTIAVSFGNMRSIYSEYSLKVYRNYEYTQIPLILFINTLTPFTKTTSLTASVFASLVPSTVRWRGKGLARFKR